MNEEQRFLEQYDPDDFDRPSVAVDVVLLTEFEGEIRVLLVRRSVHPFQGDWALPGGFLHMERTLEETAAAVLAAKTGLTNVFLEQLYTFGSPGRDPRGRVLSVSYFALAAWDRVAHIAADPDILLARVVVPWEGEQGGPVHLGNGGDELRLGFDHEDIVGLAIKRIRGKLNYAPIGYQLLPDEFTLLQLQQVHETIAGHELNKDSFRRRMLASNEIEATGERQGGVGHRPAALYRFTKRSAI